MAVKHLLRLGIAFDGPVVNGSFSDDTDRIDGNPLPENDVLVHHVGLDFGLEFNVEDLELAAG